MQAEKIALIMASLLHDIGKVALRAGKSSRIMDHSDAGFEWADKFISDSPIKKQILEGIKFHHAKKLKGANIENNNISYVVYEADNIAAGIDRREKPSEGESDTKFSFNMEKCIDSVFNIVQTSIKSEDRHKVFKLSDTLDMERKMCIPVDENSNIKASASDYSEIYTMMMNQFDKYGIDFSKESYINSLINVLESFVSLVPSSTNTSEISDISLFDHSQLTAAVASCIYDYMQESGNSDYKKECFDNPDNIRSKDAFLLVHGDVSGIQDFIYTISTKNALKTLRGRSFFLELLVEHVVDEILESLDLSRANLLYTGGGGFYMLLPNTEKSKKNIEIAKEALNNWLYAEYGMSLYVEICYSEACAYDFMYVDGKKTATNMCFKKVSEKISKGKLSRYSQETLEEIFKISVPKDANRECGVCGSSKQLIEWGEEDKEICPNCKSLIKLGEKLVYVNSDITVFTIIKGYYGKGIKLPDIFGKDDCTLSFDTLESARNKLNLDDKSISVKRVYSKNKMVAGIKGANRIFAADYSYCKESDGNKPVEFEKLVNDARGIKRLGVLRADVDSLGQLFSKGFRTGEDAEKYQTLGRYISISKNLTRFFKDTINRIAEKNGEKYSLAIVYSGGDDVFAVAPWDQAIEFGRELRKEFEKYTCGALSFSAGIGFYDHNYPISRMAEETGKLENYSKHIDAKKDKLALFGMESTSGKPECRHVYGWKEFENVLSKSEYLYGYLCENGDLKIGKSKLYNYLKLINEAQISENEGISIARLAYMLGRQYPGKDSTIDEKNRYEEFKENIYKWITDRKERQQLATAIQLAIYKVRGGDIDG